MWLQQNSYDSSIANAQIKYLGVVILYYLLHRFILENERLNIFGCVYNNCFIW